MILCDEKGDQLKGGDQVESELNQLVYSRCLLSAFLCLEWMIFWRGILWGQEVLKLCWFVTFPIVELSFNKGIQMVGHDLKRCPRNLHIVQLVSWDISYNARLQEISGSTSRPVMLDLHKTKTHPKR